MKFFVRLGFLVLLVVFLLGCEKEAPQKETVRSVRAIKVSGPDEFVKRWFPGQARATQEVELSFRVSGPLVDFSANVGDQVRKGNIVAKIDPRDFQVDLRNAKGKIEQSKAVLERAEADYNRVLNIQKKDAGAVSQSMIDRNKQLVDSTRAEIRSLQAEVDSASDKLSYTYLKAPFDSLVSVTYVENFEDVKAKQPIIRLIDHSKIEMVVNIPESIISYADYIKRSGKVLVVRYDPFPDSEIAAEIKEIGKEASSKTRTYPVTLIMDQQDDIKILPGMAGKAASTIAPDDGKKSKNVIIPETAVFSSGEDTKTYVWIIDPSSKKVSKREVNSGDLLDSGINILSGISPGEMVVTAGAHYLKEGQEVRLPASLTQEVK